MSIGNDTSLSLLIMLFIIYVLNFLITEENNTENKKSKVSISMLNMNLLELRVSRSHMISIVLGYSPSDFIFEALNSLILYWMFIFILLILVFLKIIFNDFIIFYLLFIYLTELSSQIKGPLFLSRILW